MRLLPGRRDEGVSTIEVVVLTPVFLSFVLFIVAFGLVVDAKGTVNGVARDAARAGSLERSSGQADFAAHAVADERLRRACTRIHMATNFRKPDFESPDLTGQYTVHIECWVSLRAFSLIGIGQTVRVDGDSLAPLDKYRRTS